MPPDHMHCETVPTARHLSTADALDGAIGAAAAVSHAAHYYAE